MPKIIPFGDRILCKRRKIGTKIGSIELPDSVKERTTDLADIIHVPDLTFGDKQILENADDIIKSLTREACKGDDEALIGLMRINEFVKIKSVKVGDAVMVGRYVGTEFHETGGQDNLVLVREGDIIGLVVNDD